MAKREGSKTVVIGGKNDVPQQYGGVVGGQSLDFTSMDTEIKVSVIQMARGASARNTSVVALAVL